MDDKFVRIVTRKDIDIISYNTSSISVLYINCTNKYFKLTSVSPDYLDNDIDMLHLDESFHNHDNIRKYLSINDVVLYFDTFMFSSQLRDIYIYQ